MVSKEIEKVSTNAAQAKKALGLVREQANLNFKAVSGFASEVARSNAELRRLKLDPEGYKRAIEASRQLTKEREKLRRSAEGGGFFGGMFNALPFRSVA